MGDLQDDLPRTYRLTQSLGEAAREVLDGTPLYEGQGDWPAFSINNIDSDTHDQTRGIVRVKVARNLKGRTPVQSPSEWVFSKWIALNHGDVVDDVLVKGIEAMQRPTLLASKKWRTIDVGDMTLKEVKEFFEDLNFAWPALGEVLNHRMKGNAPPRVYREYAADMIASAP